MSLRIFILFITIIHVHFLYAQDGILKGRITDNRTKESLAGVGVYLDKAGKATSGTDGTYELKVDTGYHEVEYRFVGYTTYLVTRLFIKGGETLVLDIPLEVSATELGVMVISAGKFEQKLEEVTVSMEVMRSTLIENKNTTSADNIMEQCPGVNILDGQANIRGGSGFSYGAGTRVMVLVDDLPILSADAGDVKWNFIPVENIEQVEIIKGASSALFGSSAMNGVINFRTSYPKDSAHTNLTVSTGIYDKPRREELQWWSSNPVYRMTSFLHSQQIKNFDLVLGANSFSDEGYRKLETEQRQRFNFNTRYRFEKIKGLSAGLNGNLMDTEGGYFILWHNADSAYYPSGGSVSEYHTTRTTLDPFILYYSPKGNKHSLRTRYYKAVNTNNTNQESISDVWYGEYQYQLHLKKDLNITSGITSTYSEVHSDSLYGNHYSSNAGFFSQADKKFKRLILSLGVRGEYFKVDSAETKYNVILGKDTSIMPIHPVFRAGMNYRLREHTHLRASFGQGYRFPSVAEKFIKTKVSGLTIYPNPEIQPETGWSAEIGLRQAFKVRGLKGYFDVACFQQEYRDMMEFTFGYWVPPGTPNPNAPTTQVQYFGAKSINVGRARITGAEITVGAAGDIRKTTFSVMGGYTYINPIDLDYDSATSGGTYNGNILKYRYEHTAKIDVQADRKKWSTGISLRYNSFMKNIDASFQNELLNDLFPSLHSNLYILPGLKEYREKHNKSDVVLDYRIACKITKEVKISIVINNLLNREYMGRPGDVQAPRSFALVLNAKV